MSFVAERHAVNFGLGGPTTAAPAATGKAAASTARAMTRLIHVTSPHRKRDLRSERLDGVAEPHPAGLHDLAPDAERQRLRSLDIPAVLAE